MGGALTTVKELQGLESIDTHFKVSDLSAEELVRGEVKRLRLLLKERLQIGDDNMDEKTAAIKLQSSFRGHVARKELFRETGTVHLSCDEDGCELVNEFVLKKELGKGAFGTVKLGIRDGKKYAIKVLNKKKLKRKRVGRFGNALQNVKKEIAVWKKLDHPHVVPLFEVIDAAESPNIYLVSEYVEGGEAMPDEMKADPLPIERAQKIFRQLILATEYLHYQNVVHRDIKPGNMLLKSDDFMMLTDFGVSSIFEDGKDEFRSTDGTAAFLAPEMFSGTAFSGQLTDIWACGITLYMMVYGETPFSGKTLPDLYEAIEKDDVQYPANPQISPDAKDLLDKIFVKDPSKRITIEQIKAHPFVNIVHENAYSQITVSADQIDGAITVLKSFKKVGSFLTFGGKLKKKLHKQRESSREQHSSE